MRISFQQGIIKYPRSGTIQQFLSKTGASVNLLAANGPIDIAFAHGTSNYLLTETATVNAAWTSIPGDTDTWLYWDIDRRTGVRTFGITIVAPVYSTTAPLLPVTDLHWFNTSTKKMYVYQTGGFREVIRVFAAKVNNATFTPMGSFPSPNQYGGSQVGLTNISTVVGRIVSDSTNLPIRKTVGEFFTSEDDFFINGSPVNALRFESNISYVTADQTAAKYQVVKYSDFGRILLAGYNDVGETAIGITVQDILTNATGGIAIQGVITNTDWNWTTVGAPLWVSENGLLTEDDPHVVDSITYPTSRVPVGRVLSATSIFFDQGLGGKGDRGPQGNQGNAGVVGSLNLNDLTDVTITAPDTGHTLIYNGLQWLNQPNVLVSTLNSLTDVDIDTPQINDMLTFDGAEWVNTPNLSAGNLINIDINNAINVSNIRMDVNNSIFVGPGQTGITSGLGNVLIGNTTAQNATIGNYNIVIGDGATQAGLGDGNVIIGKDAGLNITEIAEENLILGAYAGDEYESGQRNVLLGSRAGCQVVNGDNNILIGWAAGRQQAIDADTSELTCMFIVNNEDGRDPGVLPPFIIGDMCNELLTINAQISTPFLPVDPDHIATKAYVDSMLAGSTVFPIMFNSRLFDISQAEATPGQTLARYVVATPLSLKNTLFTNGSQAKLVTLDGDLVLGVMLNDIHRLGYIRFGASTLINTPGIYAEGVFAGFDVFHGNGLLDDYPEIGLGPGDVLSLQIIDNTTTLTATELMVTLLMCQASQVCDDGHVVQWSETLAYTSGNGIEYSEDRLTVYFPPGV